MRDTRDDPGESRPGPSSGGNGAPKFGRLLIVLAVALLTIVAITFGSEAWYS